MAVNNYLPILSESIKHIFLDYIGSLDIPLIDYFAIGIQDLVYKKSISLMSLPEWQKHFIENNYAKFDPVRRVTLHTKRNLISFQEIDFIDNFGKEIMHQRAKMGISNGIILMQRFSKFNYMITLGTDFAKFDAFDFINKHHDKLAFLKNDLISLVETEAQIFLQQNYLKNFNHFSFDTK